MTVGKKKTVLAEVLFPIPAGGPYTYRVPDDFSRRIGPGFRVIAPLRSQVLTGIVVEMRKAGPPRGVKLRNIQEVVDDRPLLGDDLLRLVRWLAEYYFCELGEALHAVLPGVFFARGDRRIRVMDSGVDRPAGLTRTQAEIWEYLRHHPRPLRHSLSERFGAGRVATTLSKLNALGLVEEEDYRPVLPREKKRILVEVAAQKPEEVDRLLARSPRQRECYDLLGSFSHPAELSLLTGKLGCSRPAVDALVAKSLAVYSTALLERDSLNDVEFPHYESPTPSEAQAAIISEIVSSLKEKKTFLLYGVTGSGKTLVYLEVLKPLLESGRQAIVLVPEIALTPQTVGRFRAVFGDRVAVLHSGLSPGERYDIWRGIYRGRFQIAVGARSAVFSPFADLGMIIIDEEHENTYKQSDTLPRYHAREVALKRMSEIGGPVLLGSATPSLESFRNASDGRYGLLELPERAGGRLLPQVRIHDLRKKWTAQGRNLLTSALVKEIGFALEAQGQVLLLLNRRGYSSLLICADCGQVLMCPHCRISLTLHRRAKCLLCHYCGHRQRIIEKCPVCEAEALEPLGSGTEAVESGLREHYKDRVVDRMDMDTTAGKWSHHEILERLRTGATDILVGTQMIAKGLDFPDVVLVGVVNADTGMNLPDFRATERTFQLLAQVAGRTGRGERGGEVFIQTFTPDHPAIKFAVKHNYSGFAERELEVRRAAGYPPFTRLVNVIFSGRDEKVVETWAASASGFVPGLIEKKGLAGKLEAVGPATCALEKIRGRYRSHLILKSTGKAVLDTVGAYLVQKLKPPRTGECRLVLDRDPASLM
ncbi:primosomal protein N' [Gemmatimonadota bacterium]